MNVVRRSDLAQCVSVSMSLFDMKECKPYRVFLIKCYRHIFDRTIFESFKNDFKTRFNSKSRNFQSYDKK